MTATETEVEEKVKEDSAGKKLRPDDKKNREKAYMEDFNPAERADLHEHLEQIASKHLTISEKLFLWGKDAIPQFKKESPATRVITEMIHRGEIGQDTIDALNKEKVETIYNPTDKPIRIDMPNMTGCSTLISSPGGHFPVTAHGSEFIQRSEIQKIGLKILDYDPKDPGMNPRPGLTGVPTADRRVHDPEFRELTEARKAAKYAKDNPGVLPALRRAMMENPLEY